jgi:hypothetical protein
MQHEDRSASRAAVVGRRDSIRQHRQHQRARPGTRGIPWDRWVCRNGIDRNRRARSPLHMIALYTVWYEFVKMHARHPDPVA